jgi:hypothetical protein
MSKKMLVLYKIQLENAKVSKKMKPWQLKPEREEKPESLVPQTGR